MPVGQTETKLTSRQLLRAVERLPRHELESFVRQVQKVRERRLGLSVREEEARLLHRINRGLPEKLWSRFYELTDRRRAETLTEQERQELLTLSQKIEAFGVARLKSLLRLAALRQVTVQELMRELGIEPPAIIG